MALAKRVTQVIEKETADFKTIYQMGMNLEDKIHAIVTKIYGVSDVAFSKKAQNQLATFEKYGWDRLPVSMAKTQYSLSDDPQNSGHPEGCTITIRDLFFKIGAGFIVALTGDVMTMPGLPKKTAALNMDVDKEGQAIGLF